MAGQRLCGCGQLVALRSSAAVAHTNDGQSRRLNAKPARPCRNRRQSTAAQHQVLTAVEAYRALFSHSKFTVPRKDGAPAAVNHERGRSDENVGTSACMANVRARGTELEQEPGLESSVFASWSSTIAESKPGQKVLPIQRCRRGTCRVFHSDGEDGAERSPNPPPLPVCC